MENVKFFEVVQVRSGAGRQKTQRLTLEGLGLRRINQVRYLRDTPAIRGMLWKVQHLIRVTPKQGALPPSNREKARQAAGAAHAAS
jgi:large subunit ribosomal protein L30